MNRRLHRAFQGWAEAADRLATNREKVITALSRWRAGLKSRALNAWIDVTVKLAVVRAVGATIVKLGDRRIKRLALTSIVDRYTVLRSARLCVMHWSHRCLSRAVNGWSSTTSRHLVNRERVASSVAKLMDRASTKSFNAWSFWANKRIVDRAKAIGLVRTMMATTVSRSFRSWRAHVQKGVADHEKAQTYLVRLRSRSRLAVLLAWHSWASRTASNRERVYQSVSRLMNRRLHRAFQGWAEAADRLATNREKVITALSRLRAGLKSRALNAWKVVLHLKIQLLVHAWHVWINWLHNKITVQNGSSAAAMHCMASLRTRVFRPALNAWAAHAARTVALRELLGQCVSRWVRQVLS
eukprot:COSAG03_NODE_6410_length_1064_cov_54.048705_1_plen_354_part_11